MLRLKLFDEGDSALKLRLGMVRMFRMYGSQFADYVGIVELNGVRHHIIFIHPNTWVLDDEAFKEDWEID